MLASHQNFVPWERVAFPSPDTAVVVHFLDSQGRHPLVVAEALSIDRLELSS